jgi:hypothetical protein
MSLILFTLVVAGICTFILWALRRIFYSPLSRIPGSWYSALSDFWIKSNQERLQLIHCADGLFKKYGPVVRVGPNKVYFLDVSAMRVVYGSFDKDVWYKSLKRVNSEHILTIL